MSAVEGRDAPPLLDDRKSAILTAIVQGYVRDGEPLSSKRVVEEWGLEVSTATVRSDMAVLEEAGLIAQPHTSAGRVPTDAGYRYFVDQLAEAAELGPAQRDALEGLLREAVDLEDLLRRATSVLSRLTRVAALVAAPRLDRSRLKHVELVQLGPTAVLAVLIADTGRVEKRMLEVPTSVAEHDVQRTRHAVNDAVAGVRLSQAADVVAGVAAGAPRELADLLEAVAESIRHNLAPSPSSVEHLFVGGTANIVGSGSFERLEDVQHVYAALEEHVVLSQMLQDTLDGGDPAVRIGRELTPPELAICSLVAARYEASEAAGSVGVLGPRRMDYPRTLGAVQAVASSLERAIAELTGARD